MKAMFIEPVLVLASSLLWVVVLPVAALICSGIALSDRLGTHGAGPTGINFPAPSSPA